VTVIVPNDEDWSAISHNRIKNINLSTTADSGTERTEGSKIKKNVIFPESSHEVMKSFFLFDSDNYEK